MTSRAGFEILRSRRGNKVFLILSAQGQRRKVASAVISLAEIRNGVAKPCSIRLCTEGSVSAAALDSLATMIRIAESISAASSRRPEGIEAPLEAAEYVRWLTDGQTTGRPDSEHSVIRPHAIPAGYYGYSPRAHWDWEANKVVYSVSVLVPGAFHRSRLATAEEMEVYDGDPFKDDPARLEGKVPSQPPISVSGGEKR